MQIILAMKLAKNYFYQNIRYLRKIKFLSQEELANRIGVKRPVIASYEEGRALPKMNTLNSLSSLFSVSIDDLLNTDLTTLYQNQDAKSPLKADAEGKNIRILTTVVDKSDNEQITVVPCKAIAGYLTGYSDPEYIIKLPVFELPFPELSKNRTYRVFQIQGESMLPIPDKSYIICEYLQNIKELQNGDNYIVISKNDGVVFKRIFKINDSELELQSTNASYESYRLHLNEILEIWKALGFISFSFPVIQKSSNIDDKLMQLKEDLLDEISRIKQK